MAEANPSAEVKEKMDVEKETEDKVETNTATQIEEKMDVDEETKDRTEENTTTQVKEQVDIVADTEEKLNAVDETKEKIEVVEEAEVKIAEEVTKKVDVVEETKEKVCIIEETKEKVNEIKETKEKVEVVEETEQKMVEQKKDMADEVTETREKDGIVELTKEKMVEKTKDIVDMAEETKEKEVVIEEAKEKVIEESKEKEDVIEVTKAKVNEEAKEKVIEEAKEKEDAIEGTKEKVIEETKEKVIEETKEKEDVVEETTEKEDVVEVAKDKFVEETQDQTEDIVEAKKATDVQENMDVEEKVEKTGDPVCEPGEPVEPIEKMTVDMYEEPQEEIKVLQLTGETLSQLTKSNLVKEASLRRQAKVLILSPVSLTQMVVSPLAEILTKCCSYRFRSTPFTKIKRDGDGYLELTFVKDSDMTESKRTLEELGEIKISSLSASEKMLRKSDTSDKKTRSKLLYEFTDDPTFEMQGGKRVVCIIGAPTSMTEDQILEIFPGFVAIIAKNRRGLYTGRAFVEFLTEDEARIAVEKNQGLVFEDHRLECFLVSDVPRKDKSGAYEEGVPMCVTQVRAMVQKPITLRARVLLQWNGDTKYLMRMMDDILEAETPLVEDEALKKERRLPGASYWRTLIAEALKTSVGERSSDIEKLHLSKQSAKYLREKLYRRLETESKDNDKDKSNKKGRFGGEREQDLRSTYSSRDSYRSRTNDFNRKRKENRFDSSDAKTQRRY